MEKRTEQEEGGGRRECIRRLSRQECLAAKPLWSEIFFQDSQAFTDYYFAEKMADNVGFGLEMGGELCAMLFLTPYTGRLVWEPVWTESEEEARGELRAAQAAGGEERDIALYYIVGVGTREDCRRRGCMNRLLQTALAFIREESLRTKNHPFTFLMPASPAIYTPYQFRYIYERPVFHVREAPEDAVPPHSGRLVVSAARQADMEELAEFANRSLAGRYQLFVKRSPAYYERLQKELRSENGDIYLWRDGKRLAGYYLYAKEGETAEIQEAILRKEYEKTGVLSEEAVKKPIIMARIVNVADMLSRMRTKDGKVEIRLRVTDSLLSENEGIYRWRVGKRDAQAEKLAAEEGGGWQKGGAAFVARGGAEPVAEAETNVALLVEFLFGRRTAAECFSLQPGKEEETLEKLARIETISRCFINEVV